MRSKLKTKNKIDNGDYEDTLEEIVNDLKKAVGSEYKISKLGNKIYINDIEFTIEIKIKDDLPNQKSTITVIPLKGETVSVDISYDYQDKDNEEHYDPNYDDDEDYINYITDNKSINKLVYKMLKSLK